MAWGARGLSSRVIALGRAGGRAPGRFHFTMVGLLLMGLTGLLCAPSASRATWEKDNPGDSKADTKGGVDRQALKAEETLIYPNDLLFIQVFDVDQMTREYRVSATGTLLFPLLAEPVRVVGLTPQQLAEVISRKCIEAGVLSHPQISVTVRESRMHAVAIVGAVRNPQIYPVFGRITLLDILSQAGGVSDDAGSTVTITRGEVSRRVLASDAGGAVEAGKSPPVAPTVTIDVRRLLETGDPSLNVDVYPGDRVMVQRAGIIYVMGAVNRAGGFPLKSDQEGMTVLQALALAEDTKPVAARSKAMVIREDPHAPSGRTEIPVDLKKLIAGRIRDPALQANDILYVPESGSAKAIRRGAETAIYTTTSLIIWRW